MKEGLLLEWCSYQAAKYAVMRWHYSRAMPTAKLARLAVFEDGQFVGAVLFGCGSNRHLLSPFNLKHYEGCELVRVALSDHKTPVSRIVAISLKLLKRRFPGLRVVVSYADPQQGHLGSIYQAGNWLYTGTTYPDKFPIIGGKVRHPRTLSDCIRDGRIKSRSDVAYVRRPGKHRYVFPLDESIRISILEKSKPFPKASETGDGSRPGAQRRGSSDPDAPVSNYG